MAVDPGDISGDSGICSLSPADMAGALDNIITRLAAVENALIALLSTNIEAEQLSDISGDLGWIYNVTYLGIEGWTQTPAGTLIPPAGWTGLSTLANDLLEWQLSGGGGNVNIDGIMSVYGSDFGTDIASSSNKFFHVNSTLTAYVDLGDAKLSEGSVASGARTGWVPDTQGTSYIVIAEWELYDGSSAPTSGFVQAVNYRTRTGSSTATHIGDSTQTWHDPAGGSWPVYVQCISSTDIGSSNPEGFEFRIYNRTDGDIQINNLKCTFIKVS